MNWAAYETTVREIDANMAALLEDLRGVSDNAARSQLFEAAKGRQRSLLMSLEASVLADSLASCGKRSTTEQIERGRVCDAFLKACKNEAWQRARDLLQSLIVGPMPAGDFLPVWNDFILPWQSRFAEVGGE